MLHYFTLPCVHGPSRAAMHDCMASSMLPQEKRAFTKSIAYKLSRDFSFSSFPGA